MCPRREAPRHRRLVTPPEPNDPRVPNRVTAVWLRPNQRVRWTWSVTPDHRTYVSGYVLVPAWGTRRVARGRATPFRPPRG